MENTIKKRQKVMLFVMIGDFITIGLVVRNLIMGANVLLTVSLAIVIYGCMGIILNSNKELFTPENTLETVKEPSNSLEKLLMNYQIDGSFKKQVSEGCGVDGWVEVIDPYFTVDEGYYYVIFELCMEDGTFTGLAATDILYKDNIWTIEGENGVNATLDSTLIIGYKKIEENQ